MNIYQALVKASLGLGLFAVFTVGLIAFTQVNTKDRIAQQKRLMTEKTLNQLIDPNAYDNTLVDSTINLYDTELLGLSGEVTAYVAVQTRQNNRKVVTHFIFPVLISDGYSGDIRLLLGLRLDGVISGVRVLEHQETPGLGDKIELKKSPWILIFNNKSLTSPQSSDWQVKKDGGEFDQFTGATITPRAIVRGIYRALNYYEKNKIQLLEQALEQAQSLPPDKTVL